MARRGSARGGSGGDRGAAAFPGGDDDALSFIPGVLPLVFASGAGAASRVSIGFVAPSGMVAATVVGVVFVPVLYTVVERVVGGRGRAGEVRQAAGADPA